MMTAMAFLVNTTPTSASPTIWNRVSSHLAVFPALTS